MHKVDPVYLEHQLKRWMRPDAHRFVRPDWRRFVRAEFQADHPFALYERKYSADQPRVPAGSSEGGQWTDGSETSGGQGGTSDPSNRESTQRNSQLAQLFPSLLRPLPLLSEPPVVPRPVIKPPLEEWPTNPKEAPPGYGWNGRPGSTPGDGRGNYTKPDGPGPKEEYLRPDFDTPGHKPHWDYRAPDGNGYRWYPDGTMEPKINNKPTIMFRLDS